ncbi:MAG: DUF4139 domain-containing protein [Kofleriaceae bacterium]
MGSRSIVLVSLVTVVGAVGGRWALSAPGRTTTQITLWRQPASLDDDHDDDGERRPASAGAAVITERRTIDVPANGEVRFDQVAATLDPISAQLTDLTEPDVTISEQRFYAGAKTPTELLARHVGARIVAITAKTEVAGVLRSVDDTSLVIETATGNQRQLHIVRRDSVVETRLPAGPPADESSLTWRLAAKKPGMHDLSLTYRAGGLSWTADYVAVLNDGGASVDFSAWATIRNDTRTTFEHAALRLISSGTNGKAEALDIATPTTLIAGRTSQVELIPARRGVKARAAMIYEPNADPTEYRRRLPTFDCNMLDGAYEDDVKRILELALPREVVLPAGLVRVFRRNQDRVEALDSQQLTMRPGFARLELRGTAEISGDRRATSCNFDERARILNEQIEVSLQSTSKRSEDVIVREYAWRSPSWRIESEDIKSTRQGRTLEYRITVPPGAKRKLSYTIVYSW